MKTFDVQGNEIRAPHWKVFEFLREPENLPKWARRSMLPTPFRQRPSSLHQGGHNPGTIRSLPVTLAMRVGNESTIG